jgi:hypothetical protein
MQKQNEIKFSQISKELINELTTITKETIAMDLIPVKKFTAVDLWNIQRRGKTTINSRKLAAFY